MEESVSEILDNLLGLLLLEGSYEMEEGEESFNVGITTKDAGRLIGARGESLDSLQFLVNLMMFKKSGSPTEQSKRVVIDVEGWRKKKESELSERARAWADQVLATGQEMELEPMSPWQRRAVHIALQDIKGVESESMGEGRDRHLAIRPSK